LRIVNFSQINFMIILAAFALA